MKRKLFQEMGYRKLPSRQKGFSLLEIMIAVMILAIGLLGMAAMQAVALSSNQEAQFRIQALAIAEDLASRMRANRDYVNASAYKYPLILVGAGGHANYNLYSTSDYNVVTAADDPVAPSTVMECGDPETSSSEAELRTRLNCRAGSDISDIRRQLNPDDTDLTNATSGRLLPAGSLMYVTCADKPNIDYNGTNDADLCSPGSVYTIYVIWPVSAGRSEAGQLDGGNNRQIINGRCATKLGVEDNPITAQNAGCVIMDLVP